MASILKVDTIQDQDGNNIINESANTITIGASGDTITIPSGATFASVGIDDNATSTAITIDSSQRVGIGTSSPGKILDIRSADPIIQTVDTGDSDAVTRIDGNAGWLQFRADNNNTLSGTNITFNIDGSEKMRIDSSGNVGIGTSSPDSRLEVLDSSATGIISRSTSTQATDTNKGLRVRNNSDTDTFSVSYKGLGYFAGNVGIGTSSPSAALDVVSAADALNFKFENTTHNAIMEIKATTANKNSIIRFADSASSTIGDIDYDHNDNSLSFTTNASERMRIDSSGNVGIGTTSPSPYNLYVKDNSGGSTIRAESSDNYRIDIQANSGNGTIRTLGSYPLILNTNQTERMRIDSSGRVGIGTSSPDCKLRVDDSANQSILAGVNSNSSFSSNGVFLQLSRNTTNNSFYAIGYYNAGAGNYKFRVADSGNVTNTNNSYGAISDEKLKENIVDATPKLEKLKQVRIVNFNFIDDNQKQIGVIAQELENIFPSMVEESPDKDEDGKDLNTTTKQVKYSVFVPILIKALQEQQTQIEDLEARITALETNQP